MHLFWRYDVTPTHLRQVAALPADQLRVWWQAVWIGRVACVVAHVLLYAFFAYAPWWGALPRSARWLAAAGVFWFFYVKYELSHGSLPAMKTGPRYPLIGQLHVLLANIIIDGGSQLKMFDRSIVFMNTIPDLGDLGGIWLFSTYPVVVVNSPAAARALTTMDPRDAPKNYAARFFLPWLGRGLLLSAGDEWKMQRRLLTPAFHFEVLRHYADVVARHADALVAALAAKTGEEIDLARYIPCATLDIICECACGFDAQAQSALARGERNEYVSAVNEACDLLAKQAIERPYLPEWLWHLMPSGRRFLRACATMHGVANRIIDERRAQPAASRGGDPDFLDMLLQARTPDGSELSHQAVLDQVNTFVFEGHDTTATGLAWAVYHIATRPEVEARVVEELRGCGGDFGLAALKRLAYLDACIKESLRLHPPVPIVGRFLRKPLVVGNAAVPAGTEVAMLPYTLHRCERFWGADALEFKPERFAPGADRGNAFAFVPFSAGSRNCIGQNFAMNEEKRILAAIFSNFRVEVLEEPVPESAIVLRMQEGLKVRLTAR